MDFEVYGFAFTVDGDWVPVVGTNKGELYYMNSVYGIEAIYGLDSLDINPIDLDNLETIKELLTNRADYISAQVMLYSSPDKGYLAADRDTFTMHEWRNSVLEGMTINEEVACEADVCTAEPDDEEVYRSVYEFLTEGI